MRLIQLADYGGPVPGSFVPMLGAALEEARGRGWRTQVVLPERARTRGWTADLPAELLFAPDVSRRWLGPWLGALVEQEPGPTILHAHFTRFDMAAATAGLRCEDLTVYWHRHTVLSDRPASRIRNRASLSTLGRRVERILCVSPDLVEGVRNRGAPAGRVEYFPNAVDASAYAPANHERRAAAREQLGLRTHGEVLLHFGRDWPLKGGDLFLRTLRILRANGRPDAVGVTVRGGREARARADEMGLGAAVVTVEAQAGMQPLYDSADLLMATSRGEGMPLTVLEALASGLGVAATDIPGHRLGQLDPPGLLRASSDPHAMADIAERLLSRDPGDARDDAGRARAWIRDEMDIRPWARRLIDLYERDQVAAGAGRPPIEATADSAA